MQLKVQPLCAGLNRDTQFFTRMDPYCIIKVGGKHQKSRTNHQGGKTPNWGDTLIFSLHQLSKLQVQVWDENMFSDSLIGKGSLDLRCDTIEWCKKVDVCLKYEGEYVGKVALYITITKERGGRDGKE